VPPKVEKLYIVWSLSNTFNNISKGVAFGITGASRSVSFQVSITPSLSQINTIPVIINDAILTGHDDFANVDVRVSKISLRTQLENDPQFPPNGGSVVE
jgi:hypothetical protein